VVYHFPAGRKKAYRESTLAGKESDRMGVKKKKGGGGGWGGGVRLLEKGKNQKRPYNWWEEALSKSKSKKCPISVQRILRKKKGRKGSCMGYNQKTRLGRRKENPVLKEWWLFLIVVQKKGKIAVTWHQK